jgi:hypothetical protein
LDRGTNVFQPERFEEGVEAVRTYQAMETSLTETFDSWWRKESSSIFTIERVLEQLKGVITVKMGEKVLSSNVEEKLATSGLFGFVQSRMYQGVWNYDLRQDFRMGPVKPNSWAWLQKIKDYRHNIYNSSTYAIDDLLRGFYNEKPVVLERRVLRARSYVHPYGSTRTKYRVWNTRKARKPNISSNPEGVG